MIVSVSHLTALDAEPELFIREAAAADFTHVGLRVLPSPLALDRYPVAGVAKRIARLRDRSAELGIGIL